MSINKLQKFSFSEEELLKNLLKSRHEKCFFMAIFFGIFAEQIKIDFHLFIIFLIKNQCFFWSFSERIVNEVNLVFYHYFFNI